MADERPSLGIWKVETVDREGLPPVFQVTRNGKPIEEPFVFKGHAVAQKGRWVRAEGLAVQEHARERNRNFKPGGNPE